MAQMKKVDLRNKDYKRCPCCELIQHTYQFWTAGDSCSACSREQCTTTECRLGTLHDR